MKLIYENALGRVELTGGGSGTFRLTETQGLSFPETEADVVRYANEPGQTVTEIFVLPRTITVSGDICDPTGREMVRAATVFSAQGALTVTGMRGRRNIKCRCTGFMPQKRKGCFIPFTLQLVCDRPYFEDVTENTISVAKKVACLTSPFTLPTAFSRRINEARIVNSGSVPVMPVIEISSKHVADCKNGIIIKNNTTGASLALSCGVLAGETITVDCENRTIFGSVQGNLLANLSPQTPMSAFSLQMGVNDVDVTIENETEPVFVRIRFRNQYGEAMV